MVNKGNHPQMALIQVGEILSFTQIIDDHHLIKKCYRCVGEKKPVGIVVDVIEFITFTPNDINGWEKGANHPGDDGKKKGGYSPNCSPRCDPLLPPSLGF